MIFPLNDLHVDAFLVWWWMPSRLITLGQPGPQALYTKGFQFFVSVLLAGSNQISQKPGVKWWRWSPPATQSACMCKDRREKSWWVFTEQKSAGRSQFLWRGCWAQCTPVLLYKSNVIWENRTRGWEKRWLEVSESCQGCEPGNVNKFSLACTPYELG